MEIPNVKGNNAHSKLNEYLAKYPNSKISIKINNLIDNDDIENDDTHDFTIDIIIENQDGTAKKINHFKKCISSLYEVPEDAIIGRSLIDGLHLSSIFLLGYEAASLGFPLESNIKYYNPEDL